MSPTTFDSDFVLTAPDAHIIAQSMVDSAKRINKAAPSAADLAEAITAITPESHIKGSSALKLTIEDPGWALLDSGFFSPSDDGLTAGTKVLGGFDPTLVAKPRKRPPKNKSKLVLSSGKLDPLDVNYPQGSRFWWRLSGISPKAGGTMDLTFTDRIAMLLQDASGPIKASRDAMTRAEFLKMVSQRIKQYGGIEFYSEQLDKRQPIDPVTLSAPVSSNKVTTAGSAAKTPGLGANWHGLTVKGQPMGTRQAGNVNILLHAAHLAGAGEAATVAVIYAAIWESNIEKYTDNGRYWGVLSASHSNFSQFDTAGMATAFFKGGGGFRSAIQLERSGITNPAEIAVKAEAPSIWPDNAYAKESGYPGDAAAIAEAKAIVQAGGGAAGGSGGTLGPGTTVETVNPYFFTIGTTDNAHESLWDGMTRLAQEVNWELFTDGNRMYYDSEMTLIKQKVAAVIDRDDEAVVDWYYDWEVRNIATQFTLQLVCDPFEFRAGEVLQLESFGPASIGSTAKLPGRWLIADITRNPGDLSSQFTLKQPEQQKNEPAPSTTTVSLSGGTTSLAGGSLTGVASKTGEAAFAAARLLDSLHLPYIWGGGHGPGQLDAPNPPGFDCSGAVCWVLHKSGMWGPSYAAVSGDLASSWGQPGRGSSMTVWANGGHTFIEFNLPGGHYQMNTVNPGDRGPRVEPWSYSNADAGDGAANSGAFTPRHWPGT